MPQTGSRHKNEVEMKVMLSVVLSLRSENNGQSVQLASWK